jgi:hypothetical protein
MTVIYEIDPMVALQHGLDRFNIIWRNVGNTGTGADAESVLTAPQQFSIAGIAIAPSSQITQVTVRSVSSPPFGSSQIITPTSPFIGDIPAPWQASVGGFVNRFTDSYLPTGSSVLTAFGQTMGDQPLGTPVFGGVAAGNFPVCDLIAYLRPPSSVLNADVSLSNFGQLAVPGGTTVVRVLCVQGRRRLRAVFKASAGGSYDAQITGAPGRLEPTEFVLGVAVTVAASGEGVILIDPLTDVYWIFIKLTLNAGAPVASWQLLAE